MSMTFPPNENKERSLWFFFFFFQNCLKTTTKGGLLWSVGGGLLRHHLLRLLLDGGESGQLLFHYGQISVHFRQPGSNLLPVLLAESAVCGAQDDNLFLHLVDLGVHCFRLQHCNPTMQALMNGKEDSVKIYSRRHPASNKLFAYWKKKNQQKNNDNKRLERVQFNKVPLNVFYALDPWLYFSQIKPPRHLPSMTNSSTAWGPSTSSCWMRENSISFFVSAICMNVRRRILRMLFSWFRPVNIKNK